MPGSREEDFYRNNAFSRYDLIGKALAGVMKFIILVDPSLVIISIYYMPGSRREKKERKKYAFLLYDLYGHTLA